MHKHVFLEIAAQLPSTLSFTASEKSERIFSALKDRTFSSVIEQFSEQDFIFARNSYQESPLHVAIQTGDLEACTLIVQRFPALAGNKPVNANKDPPLLASVQSGDSRLIELFLKDADVNGSNIFGDTPLHIAAKRGDGKLCELLLKHGAVLEVEDHLGNYPLAYASEKDFREVVELLIRHAPQSSHINHRNQLGNSALMFSAQNGHVTVVKMLVESGADINLKDNKDADALSRASLFGHMSVTSLLKAANESRF
mmetsp:Transcript_18276/g.30032  ORF Transcript_18276/g.30032 Transcript_18276/m.30032 type:complete len:255 (+) Transcript_18276:111-875(+)